MRFFIVDDDQAIRYMLAEIIEDYDLGEVVGEAENGSLINHQLLNLKNIDILIIDLLMPIKDGIQTVRDLGSSFHGKTIMISQVENKEMIGEAYSLGVEHYITKPINRLEVIGVIQKVIKNMQLQKSIYDIQKTLNVLGFGNLEDKSSSSPARKSISTSGQFLLTELGIIGETGSKDLLDMLEYLFKYEKENPNEQEFPPLKDIFINIAQKRLGTSSKEEDIKKEMKASEQRVRRAILQALNHLASLGLTDYSNPKFEEYATNFFDFTEVRKKMLELQNDLEPAQSRISINTKKFVKVLYLEAKKRI